MSELVAQLSLESDAQGFVWRLVTSRDSIADQAWQQRDSIIRMGDGAAAFEVVWKTDAGDVVTRHQPDLPDALAL
jgi:hypothetical protein